MGGGVGSGDESFSATMTVLYGIDYESLIETNRSIPSFSVTSADPAVLILSLAVYATSSWVLSVSLVLMM